MASNNKLKQGPLPLPGNLTGKQCLLPIQRQTILNDTSVVPSVRKRKGWPDFALVLVGDPGGDFRKARKAAEVAMLENHKVGIKTIQDAIDNGYAWEATEDIDDIGDAELSLHQTYPQSGVARKKAKSSRTPSTQETPSPQQVPMGMPMQMGMPMGMPMGMGMPMVMTSNATSPGRGVHALLLCDEADGRPSLLPVSTSPTTGLSAMAS